jgi:hypothetical protein
VQIPLPPVDEKKKVVEDVDKDRRYAIDASIVRIMKSRKVMAHTQLVAECVEQLSRMFKVLTVHFLFSTYLVIWNLALAVVAHHQIPYHHFFLVAHVVFWLTFPIHIDQLPLPDA